ncbi:hypothetical protein AB0I84_05905 [Streptomyces spectabilis]|uniref:hypothetical protein n=1 Tax=Streptomyces spectabilis TaxID=68270 RepID=UPI0033C88453
MGSYDDPAWVRIGDDEYEVRAQLHSATGHVDTTSFAGRAGQRGLPSWGGTLFTNDDNAWWEIQQADEAVLRLTNGEERTIHAAGRAGEGEVSITGRGSVPF